MIHLTCALKYEAEALIDTHQLSLLSSTTLFKIYHNTANTLSLTVTGVGKINAAAATAMTIEKLGCHPADAWLNIGIAGHQSYPVGTIYLVNRIRDSANGNVWYPQFTFRPPLTTAPLLSLDTPSHDYRDELYDMEAAGFYTIASRHASSELIHVLKIISDNSAAPADQVQPATIREVTRMNQDTINQVISILSDTSRELHARYALPAEYESFLSRWHFSVYQQHKLQHLLQSWQTIRPNETALDKFDHITGSSEVLQCLDDDIQQLMMNYQYHVPDNIY